MAVEEAVSSDQKCASVQEGVHPTHKAVGIKKDSARGVDRNTAANEVGPVGEPHVEVRSLPVEDGTRLTVIQAIFDRLRIWPGLGWQIDRHREPFQFIPQSQEPEPLAHRKGISREGPIDREPSVLAFEEPKESTAPMPGKITPTFRAIPIGEIVAREKPRSEFGSGHKSQRPVAEIRARPAVFIFQTTESFKLSSVVAILIMDD